MKISISSYPQICFEREKTKEASLANAGHLKFCFVSAARIASQEYGIIFSNLKSKIYFYSKKFFHYLHFIPTKWCVTAETKKIQIPAMFHPSPTRCKQSSEFEQST